VTPRSHTVREGEHPNLDVSQARLARIARGDTPAAGAAVPGCPRFVAAPGPSG